MKIISKACHKCGSTKILTEFHRRTTNSDGRRNECKACVSKRMSKYWRENRERKKAEQKRRRADNVESLILSRARGRAKKKGIEFNLELEDIKIPTHCPLLSIKLIYGSGDVNTSPSLDRLIPSKGYIKGNVRVISHRANNLKRDATVEEFKLMASRLDKYITEGD